jgi:hypothetical protein
MVSQVRNVLTRLDRLSVAGHLGSQNEREGSALPGKRQFGEPGALAPSK